MRLNYTVLLVVLILSFGFTTTSGINTTLNGLKAISEDETSNFETNREIKLVLDNNSAMSCSLQTRKSTLQSVGNKSFSVSVGSSWICK